MAKIKIQLKNGIVGLNPLRSGLGFNYLLLPLNTPNIGVGLNPLRSGLGFNINLWLMREILLSSQSPQIGSWFQFKFQEEGIPREYLLLGLNPLRSGLGFNPNRLGWD